MLFFISCDYFVATNLYFFSSSPFSSGPQLPSTLPTINLYPVFSHSFGDWESKIKM